MAVPSGLAGGGYSHMIGTDGNAFTAQTQGGTILGNDDTSAGVITRSLSLLDNPGFTEALVPKSGVNGLVGSIRSLSTGTFAYSSAGNYVIRTISETLSGVSSNAVYIPGSDANGRRSIYQHEASKGAKTLTKWRSNQFTLTGRLDSGASNNSRLMWLNSGGTAAEAPAALNENMWDIADGDATDRAADGAAQPTRAIPGELVMKVDFVTLGLSGGDHFDYKAITGM